MADLNTEGGYVFNTPAQVAALREKVSTLHDVNRLSRYAQNWQMYLGVQWNFQREDGEPLITVNYLAALLDKKIAFLIGNDWTLNVPPALQPITSPVLQKVWEENGRQRLNYEIAQEGAVTGDCFVLVTVAPATVEQRKFDPLRAYRIVIQRLNSHECFPAWDENAPPTKYGRPLRSFTIVRFFKRQKPGGKKGEEEDVKWTMQITPEEITVKLGDDEPVKEKNLLEEIPVVHIPNKVTSRTFYGVDDCTDLIPLNKEYNEKSTDISDSINYNAAPITVIKGAKAKSLERSPRAIWSNLPADADVFHLKLEGELQASVSYLERTKKAMHEIAGVPEGSLGQLQPITGTSGETLAMTMAPLVDERNKKKTTYEPGFERVNYFILRYAEVYNGLKLPTGLCERCGGRIAITYIDDPLDTRSDKELVEAGQDEEFEGELVRVPADRNQIEVRRCYMADPHTFDFLDPAQVKIQTIRQHSFGNEIAKVTLAQAAAEHGFKNVSAYDVPDPAPLNPGAPAQAPTPKNPEGTPETPPEQAPRLPRVSLPAEPEELDLQEVSVNHEGRKHVVQAARKVVAVPIEECNQHTFLSPYTNWVTFNDTLPKDKAGQADLLMKYQQMGVVSKAYVMSQIGIENVNEMLEEIRSEGATTEEAAPQSFPPESEAAGEEPAGGPGSEPTSEGA